LPIQLPALRAQFSERPGRLADPPKDNTHTRNARPAPLWRVSTPRKSVRTIMKAGTRPTRKPAKADKLSGNLETVTVQKKGAPPIPGISRKRKGGAFDDLGGHGDASGPFWRELRRLGTDGAVARADVRWMPPRSREGRIWRDGRHGVRTAVTGVSGAAWRHRGLVGGRGAGSAAAQRAGMGSGACLRGSRPAPQALGCWPASRGRWSDGAALKQSRCIEADLLLSALAARARAGVRGISARGDCHTRAVVCGDVCVFA
jgi:hypothetical protein